MATRLNLASDRFIRGPLAQDQERPSSESEDRMSRTYLACAGRSLALLGRGERMSGAPDRRTSEQRCDDWALWRASVGTILVLRGHETRVGLVTAEMKLATRRGSAAILAAAAAASDIEREQRDARQRRGKCATVCLDVRACFSCCLRGQKWRDQRRAVAVRRPGNRQGCSRGAHVLGFYT